jgi:hypothetical protein
MWIRPLILVIAVLVIAPPAAAHDERTTSEVRMFAVGNKQRLDDAVTYADFHNKMAALMDRGFPNRATSPGRTTAAVRATCSWDGAAARRSSYGSERAFRSIRRRRSRNAG